MGCEWSGARCVLTNFLSYLCTVCVCGVYVWRGRSSARAARGRGRSIRGDVDSRHRSWVVVVVTFAVVVGGVFRPADGERWGVGVGGGAEDARGARASERKGETERDVFVVSLSLSRSLSFFFSLSLLSASSLIAPRWSKGWLDSPLTFSRPWFRDSGAPWARRRPPPPAGQAF